MTKTVAFGLAGPPRAGQRAGALRFRDAVERGAGCQVAGVDGVFSSENRMQGAQVFAERRDTGVEGR
jgi:hypothetical protein